MNHPTSSSRQSERRITPALAVLAITLCTSGRASADDVYWLGGGSGDNHFWSSSGNWYTGAVPASGDVVHLRGALAGATNTNDLATVHLSQLLFQDVVTSGQSWNVGGMTTADLVQNQTQYSQTLGGFSNFYDATIDNATPRTDAGFLSIGKLGVADNLPSRSGVSTVTLKPGANGIGIDGLSGTGNVVIDGPGYVALDVGENTLNGTIALKSGTLALTETNTRNAMTRITLAAGTTVVLDKYINGQSLGGGVSALNGAATLQNAGDVYLDALMSGSFIKTGAGRLDLNEVADGSSIDLRQGSMSVSHVAAQRPSVLAALNVAAGATFYAGYAFNNVVANLTGSGTVALNGNPSMTLTPTTTDRQDNVFVGTGTLTLDGPGAVEFRVTSSYGGGTTIRNGTAIVTAATGGLGSGPVTVTGGTLAGSGRVSGVVSVGSGGTVAPARADGSGQNTGTFTVGGLDLTAGGTVAIEFNGITAGTTVDQLAVNNGGAFGDAKITNGRLSLSRLSSFNPALGKFNKVSILKTAGTLTGVFAGVGSVRVNDDYSFAVTYDGKNVYAQLADVSDTNLDNVQDYRDLYALAGSYAKSTTSQVWTSGDLSGDGVVDYTDLLLANSYVPLLTDAQFATLKTLNYQEWYDYGRLNGFAVPEPASLAALSVAGLLLGRRRRAV